MLYTALNLATDEVLASNSFKTVYEAVITQLTSGSHSIGETWSIKKHENLNADNFSFLDTVFNGEEIYSVLLTTGEIIVYRVYDRQTFSFRARYFREPFNSRL